MKLKATLCFLVIFLAVTYPQAKAAIWRKANYSPVCFGTRGSQFGSFRAPISGRVASIKLVHLYGYVSCHRNSASNWSFWGCGYGMPGYINVVITTTSNYILFPPTQFMVFAHKVGKWAKVPGYNSFSKEIVFSRFYPRAFSVSKGYPFRLWYGEDLVNYSEGDNNGAVCADVYILYV